MRLPFELGLVLALTISFSPLLAQEKPLVSEGIPVNRISPEGHEFENWLWIGPFAATGNASSQEARLQRRNKLSLLSPSSRLNEYEGKAWRSTSKAGGYLNLKTLAGAHSHADAYLISLIQSDKAGTQTFLLGVNDEARVWINGTLVCRAISPYRIIPDEFIFTAELQAGLNTCLVECHNGTRDWHLAIRPQPAKSSIHVGRIVFANGSQASWTAVTATDSQGHSVRSGANNRGLYTLVIPESFSPPIMAHFTNQGYRGSLEINPSLPIDERPIGKIAWPGVIEGRVFESAENPLSNAAIDLFVEEQETTTQKKHPLATTSTDTDGKYRFANLDKGRYRVRLSTGGDHNTEHWESGPIQQGPASQISGVDFHRYDPWQGHWDHYTGVDNLASMASRTLFQDSEGYLWIGSSSRKIAGSGVSRYDGRNFKTWDTDDGLADNSVNAIAETSDRSLWFGTRDGLSRWKDQQLTRFGTDNGLPDNWITALEVDKDGILWIGTTKGLVQFKNDEITKPSGFERLPDQYILSLETASNGNLWIGTRLGASYLEQAKLQPFGADEGLLGEQVETIHHTAEGATWLGTEKGVTCVHEGSVQHYAREDGLLSNHVYSIASDKNHNIWIGTSSRLYIVHEGHIYPATGTMAEPVQGFEAIYKDLSGNIWLATGLGGLFRYQDSLTTINENHGIQGNSIASSHIDEQENLWVGSQSGLSRIQPFTRTNSRAVSPKKGAKYLAIRNYSELDGLPSNHISRIVSDGQEGLWIGTGGMHISYAGLAHYRDQTFRRFTKREGLRSGRIHSFSPSQDATTWIGTNAEIAKLSTNLRLQKKHPIIQQLTTFLSENQLKVSWFYDVFQDQEDTLWIATREGGVLYGNAEGFQQLTTRDGLPSNRVQSISQDELGRIWFGTYRGIVSYDGDRFQTHQNANNTPQHRFEDAYRDSRGTIWFASWGHGVIGYNGEAWTSLDERDGLGDNRVFSVNEDSQGTLYFNTSKGITAYQRSDVRPKVWVQSIQTDRGEVRSDELPDILTGTRVSVQFSSIDFQTRPEKRQYRTRIHGPTETTEWSHPRVSDPVSYTHLTLPTTPYV